MNFFGSKGLGMLLLFLTVGAILGGIFSEILAQASFSGVMPFLTKQFSIFDIQNVRLNLYVLEFNFGLRFSPNLLSLLGIAVAAYIFRRL